MTKEQAFRFAKNVVSSYFENLYNKTGKGDTFAMLCEIKMLRIENEDDVENLLTHTSTLIELLDEAQQALLKGE